MSREKKEKVLFEVFRSLVQFDRIIILPFDLNCTVCDSIHNYDRQEMRRFDCVFASVCMTSLWKDLMYKY